MRKFIINSAYESNVLMTKENVGVVSKKNEC